ncbi:MAG: multidrug ABC transporter ATP-binding protein [Planctomycetota bacterium]|nr:MAG: multidrug ABC transporter ATP-binding protein [Planctomycetota bacterium]
MISVKNLTKRYGPVLAVSDISFEVQAGQIVGFLGPNGAGKSTTIRILTCYQPATSGQATIAGYDVFTQSVQVRRQIGYLPESAPLYPEMRVREYLHFRGKLHGLDRAARDAAIARVTDRCWLGEFINRPIGQLSKGMRQRVGLADAMLHNPKVLILDEPTIGLDPTQIQEQRKLITELGKSHTILFSSHTLSEVERLCTHVIVIASGRILASGTPEKLRQSVSAGSRLIAEMKGPAEEIRRGVSAIAGVKKVDVEGRDGWQRLSIEAGDGEDVREPIFALSAARGWTMREMRREVASLEDFFVKITAEQRAQSGKR